MSIRRIAVCFQPFVPQFIHFSDDYTRRDSKALIHSVTDTNPPPYYPLLLATMVLAGIFLVGTILLFAYFAVECHKASKLDKDKRVVVDQNTIQEFSRNSQQIPNAHSQLRNTRLALHSNRLPRRNAHCDLLPLPS